MAYYPRKKTEMIGVKFRCLGLIAQIFGFSIQVLHGYKGLL